MQVILNKQEKEQLVIKLHQEDKTIRQIASVAHLSFFDIGSIIRKIDGQDNDSVESKALEEKSVETKALSLFSSGKKPIDVAVELDISASEVQNILEDLGFE